MEEVIDDDSYKLKLQCFVSDNIDCLLKRNGLFILDALLYTVGDSFLIHLKCFYIFVMLQINCKMD